VVAEMKTIGLVGGVASGKSRVARMLVELGAGLLDADRAGHAVLADDDVMSALRERWGAAVFAADGSVNRAAVADRVFGRSETEAADRQFLEDLLHLRIRRRLEAERLEMVASGRPAVVLDAPLLLEAGWDAICDIVLMVDAARETRLARARNRGWSETQFDEREAAQWPVERKREAADVVVNNDGTEEELSRAVRGFWEQHVAMSEGR
jgi:dephospho-CoA kinase